MFGFWCWVSFVSVAAGVFGFCATAAFTSVVLSFASFVSVSGVVLLWVAVR